MLFALQVYTSHVASNQDMQPTVGLADVNSLAPIAAASSPQQVPANPGLNEADSADSWIQSAALGQQADSDNSKSAAYQAGEQIVSPLTPHSQAFHTPPPPPQSLPYLSSMAANHLSTAGMPSSPVMPTAAASASDATSTAMATVPASLLASELAVAGTDSVCTSAMLLPGMASAAAANVIEAPQAHVCGSPHLHAVAEEMLQDHPMTSAVLSDPLVAAKLLAPAAATPPLAEGQGSSPPPASRMPFRPSPTAGTALPSLAMPTSPPPAAVLPPTISAVSADLLEAAAAATVTHLEPPPVKCWQGNAADPQAAAEEAAAAATMNHLAPPAVNHWQSNATVQHQEQQQQREQQRHQQQQQQHQQQQQQHDLAPVHYEQGGVFPSQIMDHPHHNDGRGQEGAADLLYEHLAAVLATVPALRDRVLTFAPLHSQLQCSGTNQPGRDAGR